MTDWKDGGWRMEDGKIYYKLIYLILHNKCKALIMQEDVREAIMKILTEAEAVDEDTAQATLHIAKGVFGKKGTTRMVNPELYRMQKDGLVEKITESGNTKPRWYILPSDEEKSDHDGEGTEESEESEGTRESDQEEMEEKEVSPKTIKLKAPVKKVGSGSKPVTLKKAVVSKPSVKKVVVKTKPSVVKKVTSGTKPPVKKVVSGSKSPLTSKKVSSGTKPSVVKKVVSGSKSPLTSKKVSSGTKPPVKKVVSGKAPSGNKSGSKKETTMFGEDLHPDAI